MTDHGLPWHVADWCHDHPGAEAVYRTWTADLVAAGMEPHLARAMAAERLGRCVVCGVLVLEYGPEPARETAPVTHTRD